MTLQSNTLPLKKILLFGAGKSATCLIAYLIQQAANNNWQITIADGNFELAQNKSGGSLYATPVQVDVKDDEQRNALIEQADIVISMLPPGLHLLVAKNCLTAGRHLLTASYADAGMKKLEPEIRKKGLLFLCEMGLDPGIDHMSAMQIIHRIRTAGGKITAFYSHCGGLVAPESDDNPWHYKISWNPRNIVLAGKTGAIYKLHNEIRHLAYNALFDAGRLVEVPGYGSYAWYPNRDSLIYLHLYGLEDTATFIRTTLRHPDFCIGWKKIIELELTDEKTLYDTDNLSYHSFFNLHLSNQGLKEAATGKEKQLLSYLGLYGNGIIGKGIASAADIIQSALEKNLMLQPADKDMIIMLHEISYADGGGELRKITSSLIVKGENNLVTAMAKTVGLPLGIAATLILQEKISLTGLHIPIAPEIYVPVLDGLGKEGIVFGESLI